MARARLKEAVSAEELDRMGGEWPWLLLGWAVSRYGQVIVDRTPTSDDASPTKIVYTNNWFLVRSTSGSLRTVSGSVITATGNDLVGDVIVYGDLAQGINGVETRIQQKAIDTGKDPRPALDHALQSKDLGELAWVALSSGLVIEPYIKSGISLEVSWERLRAGLGDAKAFLAKNMGETNDWEMGGFDPSAIEAEAASGDRSSSGSSALPWLLGGAVLIAATAAVVMAGQKPETDVGLPA
jgi:hypothetical protein